MKIELRDCRTELQNGLSHYSRRTNSTSEKKIHCGKQRNLDETRATKKYSQNVRWIQANPIAVGASIEVSWTANSCPQMANSSSAN